jgi:transposase
VNLGGARFEMSAMIENGTPTEALVAKVIVNKYADHLPLYRQVLSTIFRTFDQATAPVSENCCARVAARSCSI